MFEVFSPLFNTAQHTDRESQFQLVKVLIRTFDHLSTPNIAKPFKSAFCSKSPPGDY